MIRSPRQHAGPNARNWIRIFLTVALLGWSCCGAAHDVPPSTVALDVGRRTVQLELELQLSELASATRLPLESDPQTVVRDFSVPLAEYLQSHISANTRDGRAYAVRVDTMSIRQTKNPAWISNDWLTATLTLQAPSGADTDFVDLHYSVVMHRVVSHPALLYLRHDVRAGVLGDSPVLIGTFAFGTPHVVIDAAGHSWWLGFRHLFRLGVRHIAEGTDHLLFLLTLLLPAPLVACRRRWRARGDGWRSAVSVVKIVSGFTVGHSLTLGLAACGLVSVPAKVVEVAIALSVLVSAVHALRPLFPGREAWVAAGFGLIHGLAFAEMLSGLQFDPTSLLVGLAAFNLGIETMQLAVVAVAVPLLLLASRHTGYGWLRVLLALVAAACAAAWIGERLLGLDNPLSPVLAWLAQPPPLLLILLASASGLAAALELLMPIRLRSEPSEKKLSARSAP